MIAYNHYADKVVRLEYRYDGFMEEFSSILQRHARAKQRRLTWPTPLQKRKLMGEINVVPYIDVMLVLLVIFMVTAPLLTQGIEVDLPEAAAEPIEDVPNSPPLVLSVDSEGNFYINVGDDEDKPTTAQAVNRASRDRAAPESRDPDAGQGGPQRAVWQCRRRHGRAAAGRGVENIGFVTDPLDTYPIPE